MHTASSHRIVFVVALVLVAIVSAARARADDEGKPLYPGHYHILPDGRLAKKFVGKQIEVFDGVGADAKLITSIELPELAAVVSPHGGAIATTTQYVNGHAPATIYDRHGKRLGGFELERNWRVSKLSEDGNMVQVIEMGHAYPTGQFRVLDRNGKPVAAALDRFAIHTTTSDGLVIASSPIANSKAVQLSVLDARGRVISTWDSDGLRLTTRYMAASKGAAIVVAPLFNRDRADTLVVWRPKANDSTQVRVPNEFGELQTAKLAVAENGRYIAAVAGATGLVLLDATEPDEAPRVVLHQDIADLLPATGRIRFIYRLVSVSDDGSVTAHVLIGEGRRHHSYVLQVDWANKTIKAEHVTR